MYPLLRSLVAALAVAFLVLSGASAVAADETPAPHAFELRRVFDAEAPDRVAANLPRTEKPAYMEKVALLDETSLKTAAAQPGRYGWEILITLTEPGGKLFHQITKDSLGKQIGIVCGGVLLSAPRVNEEIPGGSLVISGTFDQAEAEKLAAKLNAAIRKP